MKNKTSRKALLLSVLSLILVLGNSTVFAATTTKTPATPTTSNQQLKLSPVKTDVTVSPGTTGTVKILLTNITNSTLIIKPVENDFVAKGEDGQAALILSPDQYAPSHSLKRFMLPVGNVTLPSNGGATVEVGIKVPKSAQAGGYFGALRFSPTVAGASGSTAVALGESVASLIIMTVPGPTTEQLTLTDFSVEQNGSTGSNFRTPNNLSLLVRFENKGNLQESPFGQVYIQKGKKLIYTYNFNQTDPKSEILPDSFRRWTVPVKGLGKFGKYTVGATFTYGTNGSTIEISKTVWIIPTGYIIAAVSAVAILLLLGGGSWIFLKSYKRRILKSSRRRY